MAPLLDTDLDTTTAAAYDEPHIRDVTAARQGRPAGTPSHESAGRGKQ